MNDSYLLNAPEEDMQRWKGAAIQRRLSFAEWLRQAAEAFAALPPSQAAPRRPTTTIALPEQTNRRRRR